MSFELAKLSLFYNHGIFLFTADEDSFLFIKSPGYPKLIKDDFLVETEVISVSPGSQIKIIIMDGYKVWLYASGLLGWTFYQSPAAVVLEGDTVELTTWLEYGGRYAYTWLELN